jgi:hypothetical protein
MDLFRRSEPLSGGDGQRLQGVPAWEILGRMTLSPAEIRRWTTCVGYSDCYPVAFGDERVFVDLEEDDDPAWYAYQCPETFRWNKVAAEQVAIHEVRTEVLLAILAELLRIPGAARAWPPEPLLDGNLWRIGQAPLGTAPVEVWLVRNLGISLTAFLDHFNDPVQPDQGLILCAGFGLPEGVPVPRNYRMVALQTVLVDHAPRPLLDRDLLARILSRPAGASQRQASLVHFDEYTHTLTLCTRPQPWAVQGLRQGAAIRYMVSQAQAGRWDLRASEILDAASAETPGPSSRTMQSLFSGNSAWEEYIVKRERGIYGFRLD